MDSAPVQVESEISLLVENNEKEEVREKIEGTDVTKTDESTAARKVKTPTWDPKDYMVMVKPEYLLPPPAPEAKHEQQKVHEQEKGQKKSNKRPRDERANGLEKLCGMTRRGDTCTYGDSCRFSHDIAAYLSAKEPDIGPDCPSYNTFGFCSTGFQCRVGESHINRELLINMRRSEEEGGVKERPMINALPKDLQTKLRKKNFVYQRPSVITPSDVSASTATVTASSLSEFNSTPMPSKPVKLVDFSNKVYIAPLTTIGNLPWRRVMKDLGADITCGEMAVVNNLQQGQPSEWALLRRHEQEDCFGIQLACAQPDHMQRFAPVLDHETSADFIDLNCGCPIDLICNRGAGSKLMTRPTKLVEMVSAMGRQLHSKNITVKIRTGWDDKNPTAHKLLPELQKLKWKGGRTINAVFMHGRSRLQRYTRLADWEYVLQAARAQDSTLPLLPVIGNGDIFSYEDWTGHRHLLRENCQDGLEHEFTSGLSSCAMLGRGAIIKPWLPTEIHENRHWDISASERFDIYKNFCRYGMEHWGSDTQGINTTRRFLLEWLSFTHRYVPVGIVEHASVPQKLAQKPPCYRGREDLETLLSSPHSADWVEISRRLLGPLPEGFQFVPKHKSNSYAVPPVTSLSAESSSDGAAAAAVS